MAIERPMESTFLPDAQELRQELSDIKVVYNQLLESLTKRLDSIMTLSITFIDEYNIVIEDMRRVINQLSAMTYNSSTIQLQHLQENCLVN